MGRESRHRTGEVAPAAETEAGSSRTTEGQRRRSGEKKRPSSRPITGTSARLVFAPEGDKTKGCPPCERDRNNHCSSTPTLLSRKSVPTTGTSNRNTRIVTAASRARAGGGGKRREWNDSTRVDDIPPDALLCKHPGWNVAAPGRGGWEEVGASVRHRRGFFYGGSTARTITTRDSSSAPTHHTHISSI